MNIEISSVIFISLTFLYVFSVLFCIQNFQIQSVRYILILFTLGFLGSLSFISPFINFFPKFLEFIFFISRNQVLVFFWLTTMCLLKDDFKFHKSFLMIIFFKFLISIYIFVDNDFKHIEPTLKNISLINLILSISSGYVFILLTIWELVKGFRDESKWIKKWKQLILISINLIILHFVALFMLINVLLENQYIFLMRQVNPILNIICMFSFFLIILKLEKGFFIETNYLKRKELSYNETIETSLINLLTEKRIYKNPLITANEIADLLNINVDLLRYIIREKLGYKNFTNFINHFRFQDVLKTIENNKNSKINFERLASEVGFNSYSTFYRYFKEKLKVNPNDYINE